MADRIVLFICVENAGRSLMAEAMFNDNPPPGWRAESAGTRPAPTPHSRTATVLEEVGLELPHHPPRALAPEEFERATLRITMGCLDDASCPAWLLGRPDRDWALANPERLDDEGFRAVRDDLARRVGALKEELRSVPPLRPSRATTS